MSLTPVHLQHYVLPSFRTKSTNHHSGIMYSVFVRNFIDPVRLARSTGQNTLALNRQQSCDKNVHRSYRRQPLLIQRYKLQQPITHTSNYASKILTNNQYTRAYNTSHLQKLHFIPEHCQLFQTPQSRPYSDRCTDGLKSGRRQTGAWNTPLRQPCLQGVGLNRPRRCRPPPASATIQRLTPINNTRHKIKWRHWSGRATTRSRTGRTHDGTSRLVPSPPTHTDTYLHRHTHTYTHIHTGKLATQGAARKKTVSTMPPLLSTRLPRPQQVLQDGSRLSQHALCRLTGDC